VQEIQKTTTYCERNEDSNLNSSGTVSLARVGVNDLMVFFTLAEGPVWIILNVRGKHVANTFWEFL
jgi:hypothetical protein